MLIHIVSKLNYMQVEIYIIDKIFRLYSRLYTAIFFARIALNLLLFCMTVMENIWLFLCSSSFQGPGAGKLSIRREGSNQVDCARNKEGLFWGLFFKWKNSQQKYVIIVRAHFYILLREIVNEFPPYHQWYPSMQPSISTQASSVGIRQWN